MSDALKIGSDSNIGNRLYLLVAAIDKVAAAHNAYESVEIKALNEILDEVAAHFEAEEALARIERYIVELSHEQDRVVAVVDTHERGLVVLLDSLVPFLVLYRADRTYIAAWLDSRIFGVYDTFLDYIGISSTESCVLKYGSVHLEVVGGACVGDIEKVVQRLVRIDILSYRNCIFYADVSGLLRGRNGVLLESVVLLARHSVHRIDHRNERCYER